MSETKQHIITLPIYGKRVIKTEMIEIIIPKNDKGAPKTKILLPDNQNLRESHLWQIKAYHVFDVPLSPLQKLPVVNALLFKNSFLSLQGYNGKIFCSQKPLITLHTSVRSSITNNLETNFYEGSPINFTGQKVSYPKSFIEISDSSLISTTVDEVYMLKVYYSSLAHKEAKDREASFNNQS